MFQLRVDAVDDAFTSKGIERGILNFRGGKAGELDSGSVGI